MSGGNKKRVTGGELGKAIVDALRDYTEAVSEGIASEVVDIAELVKSEIAAGSPVGARKRYKRGWKVEKRDSQGVTRRIVWNKSEYRLVHLLENGHALRNGGRAKAIPHVRPVTDKRLPELEERIERVIRNGGSK